MGSQNSAPLRELCTWSLSDEFGVHSTTWAAVPSSFFCSAESSSSDDSAGSGCAAKRTAPRSSPTATSYMPPKSVWSYCKVGQPLTISMRRWSSSASVARGLKMRASLSSRSVPTRRRNFWPTRTFNPSSCRCTIAPSVRWMSGTKDGRTGKSFHAVSAVLANMTTRPSPQVRSMMAGRPWLNFTTTCGAPASSINASLDFAPGIGVTAGV